MENPCLTCIILFGQLSADHHDKKATKKRFKHHLEKYFNSCHIDYYRSSTVVETRRHTTSHVIPSLENTHRADLKDKEHRRWNRNIILSSPGQTFIYGHCHCACLSGISLISHEPVSNRRGPALSLFSFHDCMPLIILFSSYLGRSLFFSISIYLSIYLSISVFSCLCTDLSYLFQALHIYLSIYLSQLFHIYLYINN